MYKIYLLRSNFSLTNRYGERQKSLFTSRSFIQRVCVHVGMRYSGSDHATALLEVTEPGSRNLTHSALTHCTSAQPVDTQHSVWQHMCNKSSQNTEPENLLTFLAPEINVMEKPASKKCWHTGGPQPCHMSPQEPSPTAWYSSVDPMML